MNIEYINDDNFVDNRDWDNIENVYPFSINARSSYKRQKTGQFVVSEQQIDNILLAENINVGKKERLEIGTLIVLEHTGDYFIANTNGFTMRSLYSARLDKNMHIKDPAYSDKFFASIE